MAGSLDGRIRRLELLGGGEPCEECGLAPDELVTDYVLVWDGEENEEPEGPPECPGCGRVWEITITWEDPA